MYFQISGASQRRLVPRPLHKERHRLGGDGALLRGRFGAHSEPAKIARQPRVGMRVRRHRRSGQGHREPGGDYRPRRRGHAGGSGGHGGRGAEAASGLGDSILLRVGFELQNVRKASILRKRIFIRIRMGIITKYRNNVCLTQRWRRCLKNYVVR